MTSSVKAKSWRASYNRLLSFGLILATVACAPVIAEEIPLGAVVGRMTAPEVFRLMPGTATGYFKDLASLTTKGAGKYLLVYEDDKPGKNLLWVRVEFQPGAEGASSWGYLQSQIALPESTAGFSDVFVELKKRLSAKMGKPDREEEQPHLKVAEWSAGGFRRVVLRRGLFDNPYLERSARMVLLEAVIMQGDK